MAYDIECIIDGIRESRRYFLKHIKGVREDQWDWKPYPEWNYYQAIYDFPG